MLALTFVPSPNLAKFAVWRKQANCTTKNKVFRYFSLYTDKWYYWKEICVWERKNRVLTHAFSNMEFP